MLLITAYVYQGCAAVASSGSLTCRMHIMMAPNWAGVRTSVWFLIHCMPPGGGNYYSPHFADEERKSKEVEPLPRWIEAQVYVLASHCRPTVCETVSWKGVDAVLGTRSQAGSQSWHRSASLSIIFF